MKMWKNIHHTNTIQEKACVTIETLSTVDIRAKEIARDREGDYIVIKRSTHQEAIATLNTYISNNRATKYVKQQTNKTGWRNRQIHNYSYR